MFSSCWRAARRVLSKSKHGSADAVAVAFELSQVDAANRQRRWAAEGLVGFIASSKESFGVPRAKLLPFFCFDVLLETKFTGSVPESRPRLVYNPRTRTFEAQIETIWVPMGRMHTSRATYKAASPLMQVYAGYSYPRPYCEIVKVFHERHNTIPLADVIERSGRAGSVADVEEFVMPLSAAWEFHVLPVLQSLELARATALLTSMYHLPVSDVRVDISLIDVTPRAVRLPAYVMESTMGGDASLAIISGVTGEVAGDRQLSPLKICVGLGLMGSAFWLIEAGGVVTGSLLWLWFGTVAVPVATLGYYWKTVIVPAAYSARRISLEREQARDQEFAAQDGGASNLGQFVDWLLGRRSLASEFLRRFRQVQEEQRGDASERERVHQASREWEKRRPRGSESQKNEHADDQRRQQPRPQQPKSLYDVLGVRPTATTAEIKAAYRKIVMQTHPDRLPSSSTKAEREEATNRFKEASAAYKELTKES